MKQLLLLITAIFAFSGANSQIIYFPDPVLKDKLVSASPTFHIARSLTSGVNYVTIDTNANGEIEQSEALLIGHLMFSNFDITDPTGLSSFSNLISLSITGGDFPDFDATAFPDLQSLGMDNCNLSSLNVAGLSDLTWLDAHENNITSLDLTGLGALQNLRMWGNQLTSINVVGLLNLIQISISDNQLTALNVTGLNNLEYLSCGANQLTSLSITNLNNLIDFSCSDNPLTILTLAGLPDLLVVGCSNTLLSTLNLNELPKLYTLALENNPDISSLFIKNGFVGFMYLYISNNPNLMYICADESDIADFQEVAPVGCEVNSYCSLVPGGQYYSIFGGQRWDVNNNGCTATDPSYPFVRINQTNTEGQLIGSYISASNGLYNIQVQAGTHTFTPVLENPNIFTSSPESLTVTFPGASPIQSFCILANGVHPDVEIHILPIKTAQPGFEAGYRLVCRNKGNVAVSGNVVFTYNEQLLDFNTASPATTWASGNLSWSFSGLLPLQNLEFDVTFNVNEPTAIPPVNIGDVLSYNASATIDLPDETTEDNAVIYNETVVGSFDPNDKACVQGSVVGPEIAGEYVDYIIRFENTGTASAQHIVAKDVIDTAKFDLSTLIPLSSSHTFKTEILGNRVDFKFINIDLGFNDANNDGFVAFKIRTMPTLVIGDTFSNDASIYFDYNSPIVTNTAVTTIQSLKTSEFNFKSAFVLYPNPAKEQIRLQAMRDVEVESVTIIDLAGRIILQQYHPEGNAVDVSSLHAGNYILTVQTDQGQTSQKFTKK